jgi:hypothetical protein
MLRLDLDLSLNLSSYLNGDLRSHADDREDA